MALEGPFGDHTGYYNEQEQFPVLTIDRIPCAGPDLSQHLHRKPPDEPAIFGLALNEVFVPLLIDSFRRSLTSICRQRAVATGGGRQHGKQYPGHAKRVSSASGLTCVSSCTPSFIVVVDDDIDVRGWKEVIWAITTRVDPTRDTLITENTPIDYLDFASPVSGLGSKMGIEPHPSGRENRRRCGSVIAMDPRSRSCRRPVD